MSRPRYQDVANPGGSGDPRLNRGSAGGTGEDACAPCSTGKQYDVATVGAHIAAYDENLPACIVRAILLLQQPAARLDGTSLASARTLGHGSQETKPAMAELSGLAGRRTESSSSAAMAPHRSDAGLSLPGGSNLRPALGLLLLVLVGTVRMRFGGVVVNPVQDPAHDLSLALP